MSFFSDLLQDAIELSNWARIAKQVAKEDNKSFQENTVLDPYKEWAFSTVYTDPGFSLDQQAAMPLITQSAQNFLSLHTGKNYTYLEYRGRGAKYTFAFWQSQIVG